MAGTPNNLTDVDNWDAVVQAPGTQEGAVQALFARALQQLANRSLYLKNRIATPALASVLTGGNQTGGHPIIVTSGDDIRSLAGVDLNIFASSNVYPSAGGSVGIFGAYVDASGTHNDGAKLIAHGGTSTKGGNAELTAGNGNIGGASGGDLLLSSGAGTGGTAGQLKLQLAGTTGLTIAAFFGSVLLAGAGDFGDLLLGVTNPTTGIAGRNITVAGGGGGTGNQNGGKAIVKAGLKSGSGADGEVQLQDATGAIRMRVNDTGVAFNNAAPIARPAYTLTGGSTVRSLNAGTAVLADVINVLGTVIKDFGGSTGTGYGLFQ